MAEDKDKLRDWPLEGLTFQEALRYWHGDRPVDEHRTACFWKIDALTRRWVTVEATRFLSPGPGGQWVTAQEYARKEREWRREHAAQRLALEAPIHRLLAIGHLGRGADGRIYARSVPADELTTEVRLSPLATRILADHRGGIPLDLRPVDIQQRYKVNSWDTADRALKAARKVAEGT